MKLIKDYDYVIEYHLGKVNVIVDTLSCKNRLVEAQWEDSDVRELLELRKIGAQVEAGAMKGTWFVVNISYNHEYLIIFTSITITRIR